MTIAVEASTHRFQETTLESMTSSFLGFTLGNKTFSTYTKRTIRFLLVIVILYSLERLLNEARYLHLNKQRASKPGDALLRSNSTAGTPKKVQLVLGIPSLPNHKLERKAVRETWLSLARYALFDIKYKFILDNVTTDSEEENDAFHDIIYSNISVSGYAFENSRRLRIWFKHALKFYPSAEFIGKMDDDVYLCTPQIFDRIYKIRGNNLAYGHKNFWNNDAGMSMWYDEMFIIFARQLVEQYVNEDICYNKDKAYSTDACNHADMGIEEWRQRNNVNINFHDDNKQMVHFDKVWSLRRRIEKYKLAQIDLCNNNLLYHKSSLSFMYRFYHYNKGMIDTNENKKPKFVEFHVENITLSSDTYSCRFWFVGIVDLSFSYFIREISSTCKLCCQVLVADEDSLPLAQFREKLKTVNFENIFYISIEDQERRFPSLSEALSWNHFGRLNIGYMFALQHKAEYVGDLKQNGLRHMNLSTLGHAHNASHHVTYCKIGIQKVSKNGITEVWPMFVEHLKSLSQDICIEKSSSNVGLLYYVPLPKTFWTNKANVSTFLRYMPSQFVDSSNNVIFWHKSMVKYMLLTTTAGNEAYSTSLRELLSLCTLKRNELHRYYVPLPQETIGNIKELHVDKPLTSFENNVPLLAEKSSSLDMNRVFETLFDKGYVGFDDVTLIRAWTATMDSMYK